MMNVFITAAIYNKNSLIIYVLWIPFINWGVNTLCLSISWL